ncbi:MAG: hypothetical protein RIQ70_211, partial [Bacteroidota bacterium]
INGATTNYSGVFFNWVVEAKTGKAIPLPDTLRVCKDNKVQIKYSAFNSEIWTSSEPFIQLNDSTIEIAPTKSTVYYYETPTILPAGTNIVVNGGFELDNTGFTTDYTFNIAVSKAGEYSIGSQGSHAFATCTDHNLKNSSGKMMIIDGADEYINPGTASHRGANVWCQKLKVYPNTNYQVEAWATTAATSFQHTPFLSLELNGQNIDYLTTPSTGNWGSMSGIWNSKTNTSVDFCITDAVMNTQGNAFLLDDISMIATEPILAYNKIDSVVVNICDSLTNNLPVAGIANYGTYDYTINCDEYYYQCVDLKAKGAKKYTWSSPTGNMDALIKLNDSTYQFCRMNGGFNIFTPLKYQVIMESIDGLTIDTVLLTINRPKCSDMNAGVSQFGTLVKSLPCGQDTISLLAKGGSFGYIWTSPSGNMNLLTQINDSSYVFTKPNKTSGTYTYQVVSFWSNPECKFACHTEEIDTFLLTINTLDCYCIADNDKDGVCDDVDLDDDNDGILDEVECPSKLVSQTFQTSNGTTTTFQAPNADGGFRFDIYGLDNSFNLEVNGSKLVADEVQCEGNGDVNESLLIFKSDNSGFGMSGNASVWTITGDQTSPLIRLIIDELGNVTFWGKRNNGAALEEMHIKSDDPQPNKLIWNTISSNTVVLSQKVTGPTNIKGEGSGVILCTSDIDNDGIINSLDTDSDGDGCTDAIEGGAAFKKSDLSGQSLSGSVDANGVPVLAGASGQTVGSSQDVNTQDSECCTKPTVSISDTKTCVGATITASPTTGGTWTSSNPSVATITSAGVITGGSSGAITFTFTNTATGCSNTTNSVTVNALPTVSANGVVICTGSSKTLTATGATTYAWSPNTNLSATTGTTITANPTSTITYTVTGTDSKGCISTDTAVVTVNALPTMNLGKDTILCQGENVTLDAGNANTYQWNDNTTLQTLQVSTAGTYKVTIADLNNCTVSDSITIGYKTCIKDLIIEDSIIICKGDSAIIHAKGVSTQKWFGDQGFVQLNDSTIKVSPKVTPAVYYLGQDANTKIGPNLVVNGDFEQGNTGFTSDYANAANLGPAGTYAVASNPKTVHGGFATCNDHTSTTGKMMVVNGNPVANSKVWCTTVNVSSDKYYAFSTSVASVVNTSPAILQFTINGSKLGDPFVANNTNCDWKEFSETWNSAIATSANICITNQNTAGAGNDFAIDDISLQEILPFASNKDSVVVIVSDLPTLELGASKSLCSGDSIILDGGLASSYAWSTSETSRKITVNKSGNYSLEIKDANNCKKSDTIGINVNPLPVLTSLDSVILCANVNANEYVFQSTLPNTSYAWINDNTNIGLSASGNGNIPIFKSINNSYVEKFANITITPKTVTCTGKPQVITIAVIPLPTIQSLANQVVCNNSNTAKTTFSSNVSNTLFTWENSNTAIGLGANGTGDIA